MSKTPKQSELTMNTKNPGVMKYASNHRSEMSNQEKQASYTESNIAKLAVVTKGPHGLKTLGNTCSGMRFFSALHKKLYH